jgi:prolipoprotein diacylglyceryltransferase
MLYVGLVLGVAAADYVANVEGLRADRVVAALVLLIIPALIGARLLFVLTHWPRYRREPHRIWKPSEGGASMLGGLPLALLVSVPLLAVLQVPLGAFWDVAVFTILIGNIVTRAGCLLNGCCGGRASDRWFAMALTDHHGVRCRRVPVQLFDALLALLMLTGAMALWSRRPFPGAIFLMAAAAYALGRLALDPARADQARAGRLNIQQAMAAAFAAVAIAGLVTAWLRAGN